MIKIHPKTNQIAPFSINFSGKHAPEPPSNAHIWQTSEKKNWRYAHASGDMPMLSDLQLVYMVPRNSTQLLNINTTKF